MAVACARSPSARRRRAAMASACCRSAAPSDDALKHTPPTGALRGARARRTARCADRSKWRIVTFAHVAETREQAREDVKFGLERFANYFTRRRDLPDHPARHDRCRRVADRGRHRLHRHAGRLHRHFERLWKGSVAALAWSCCWRRTGPTGRRPSAHYELMARFVHPHFQRGVVGAAPAELRHRHRQPRHLFGAVAGGRPGEIEKYKAASPSAPPSKQRCRSKGER